jgi:hypothetical protein
MGSHYERDDPGVNDETQPVTGEHVIHYLHLLQCLRDFSRMVVAGTTVCIPSSILLPNRNDEQRDER